MPLNEVEKFTAALLREQIATEVLKVLLDDNPDARTAGVKVHLTGFVLGCSPCATQRALAERLGVSEARVSQMIKSLRRSMSAISGL